MSTALTILAVSTLLIFLNAFYVIAEFATVSARQTLVKQQAVEGNPLAQLLEPILADAHLLDTYIAVCQLGITLSSLILGFYGQANIAIYLIPLFEHFGGMQEIAAKSLAATVILLLLTVFQVVFGELVPKSIALRYPEKVALGVVIPMNWSLALFRPMITLFNGTGNLLLHWLGVPPNIHPAHILSPEEIEYLVAESAKGGLLEAGERQLLQNTFRVIELTAADVMMPRTRLVAAPADIALPALLELATSTSYTRIPLYDETIDKIVGIVHLKDLFRLHSEKRSLLSLVLRPVSYAPGSKSALAVLDQLQKEKSYVAIVLDEFGGTAGMITIEDLIEEIFGELQDESDEEEDEPAPIAAGPDGSVRLHGEVLLNDVNERLGLKLPDAEVKTIGGLAMALLERLPKVGDEIRIGEGEEALKLRIEAVNGPAVREVILFLPTPKGEESEA